MPQDVNYFIDTQCKKGIGSYILAAGHAVLACGEIVEEDFSMNQEPAEAIQAYA